MTRGAPRTAADTTTHRTGTADTGEVLRLGPAGVAWRAVLTAVLTGLFLAGSLVGDDHWWPFGPWRMFSTSTPPSGAVVAMSLEVRTGTDPQWRPAPILLQSVGLNRAEVEGRVPQITQRPQMLGTLAATHARLRPQEPRWTAVRLVRSETVLVDRRPTGEVRRIVLATWTQP